MIHYPLLPELIDKLIKLDRGSRISDAFFILLDRILAHGNIKHGTAYYNSRNTNFIN